MKPKHASSKRWALPGAGVWLALFFVTVALTGEQRASRAEWDSSSDSRLASPATATPEAAGMPAQSEIRACVRPPELVQPLTSGERPSYHNAASSLSRRPCPEGLVPQPVDKWIPRGRPPYQTAARSSYAISAVATVPSVGSAYYYAGAYQWVSCDGASVHLTQHLPWLMPYDHHSLAEMAVASADSRQIIEVGWTVDRTLNSDEKPHLFVYHWVDGVASCYNGCGWVQVSPTRYPGMQVPYDGTAHQYMIQYREGNWWVGYDGEWIGYYPGSLWGGTFTTSGLIQWFGELAAGQGATPPLSSIGNYHQGTSGNPNTAEMSRITLYYNGGADQGPATPTLHSTDSARFNTSAGVEPNSFTYGGHGDAL